MIVLMNRLLVLSVLSVVLLVSIVWNLGDSFRDILANAKEDEQETGPHRLASSTPTTSQEEQGVFVAQQQRQQLPPFPWQWIHPRKTGTSFGNALYMLACPEEYNQTLANVRRHSMHPKHGLGGGSKTCRQKWKHGYQYTKLDRPKERYMKIRGQWWLGEHARRNTSLTNAQLFMTLREPVDRIISHLFHMGSLQRFKNNQNKTADTALVARHVIRAKAEHARMTSFLFPPNTTRQALHALVHQACRVVDDMAWVGFTEHFDESVCLLHARFDNVTNFPRHPAELTNMRPGAQHNATALNVTRVGELVRQQVTLVDDTLYQCALKRFQRDLQQFAPHCSKF